MRKFSALVVQLSKETIRDSSPFESYDRTGRAPDLAHLPDAEGVSDKSYIIAGVKILRIPVMATLVSYDLRKIRSRIEMGYSF